MSVADESDGITFKATHERDYLLLEDDDSDLGQASPALRPAASAPVVPSMEGKKAV